MEFADPKLEERIAKLKEANGDDPPSEEPAPSVEAVPEEEKMEKKVKLTKQERKKLRKDEKKKAAEEKKAELEATSNGAIDRKQVCCAQHSMRYNDVLIQDCSNLIL